MKSLSQVVAVVFVIVGMLVLLLGLQPVTTDLMLAALPRERFKLFSGQRPLGTFTAHAAQVHAVEQDAPVLRVVQPQHERGRQRRFRVGKLQRHRARGRVELVAVGAREIAAAGRNDLRHDGVPPRVHGPRPSHLEAPTNVNEAEASKPPGMVVGMGIVGAVAAAVCWAKAAC